MALRGDSILDPGRSSQDLDPLDRRTLLRVRVLLHTRSILLRGVVQGVLREERALDLLDAPEELDALKDAVAAHPPDVLILDAGDDPAAALSLLEHLHLVPAARGIDVLLLAGSAPAAGARVRAYELGVQEILLEPLEPEVLRSRLRGAARRRLKERGLRAQLELFRHAVDHQDQRLLRLVDDSPLMALEVGTGSGTILGSTPAARDLLGIDGQATGANLLERIQPEDREALASYLLEAAETEGHAPLTVRVPRLPHAPIHVEVYVRDLPEPGRTTLVLRNVTALRHAQRELRNLSSAVLHLNEGLALVDEEGLVRFANPALERLLHLPTGRLEGFPFEACFPEGTAPDTQHLEEDGRASGQSALLRPDQETIPVRWSAVRVSGAEGVDELLAFVVTDLRPELDLQTRMVHAEKLSAIGKVLSGVAHELQSPLAVVMGYAELIQKAAGPASEIHRDAGRILTATDACRDVVRSLLTVARRVEPEIRVARIQEVVDQVADLLRKPLTCDKVTLEVSARVDLPAFAFDPGRIQQVLLNLVVNARDALVEAEAGGTIRVALFRHGDGWARILVSDDGPGVPEEVRGSIFDPYFTTKPPGKGTGLGLAICRSIVEEHGGTLRLGESPEGGAEFDILLPLRDRA